MTEGNKVSDGRGVDGGQKQPSEKVTGDWGDRWERWLHTKLSSPPSSVGGGPTGGTLAAVGLTPTRPRATFRRVLSTRNGRSAHCAQSDSSRAVWWVFDWSRADTTVGCHLTGIGREGKDSDIIVAGSAFILPLELVIFACFVTIGQSIGLAWANRTSGKVGGKEFP